jgi:hypothetical protein
VVGLALGRVVVGLALGRVVVGLALGRVVVGLALGRVVVGLDVVGAGVRHICIGSHRLPLKRCSRGHTHECHAGSPSIVIGQTQV